MSTIQLLHFGEIDLRQIKDEYRAAIQHDGRKILLDLNFFEEKNLPEKKLPQIRQFLEDLELHIKEAYATIANDYESEGETYGYIEHHMEELEPEDIRAIVGQTTSSGPQDDELFEKLSLIRIGLYPEEENEFAVFDFSIGKKYTDYILAVFFNADGTIEDIAIEY